ncbi:hypothetical protein [Bradyrhizobium uaiense]|uniref:DUF1311 domain-containing protein n=1 Tax=Bradyrhizobium uaiense TaxID=2594946 RepID=A0A6P1BRM2_9BRAD|nr:hypothetical protein [Bradyrhizobium uaiense]NEV01046.1 hypothetical protein [Bradyrhizobium uaiense]
MTRLCILLASILLNLTPILAVASECISSTDIAASRSRLAAARSQPPSTDTDKVCRAYAVSFYELVTARQAAANCAHGNDRQRDLELLDSEIDAFNNALASRCGG